MPVITVHGVPKNLNVDTHYIEKIRGKLISAASLFFKTPAERNEKDFACFFPSDRLEGPFTHHHDNIVIFVDGIKILGPRADDLAKKLGEVIKEEFPRVTVQCYIRRFEPAETGFWFSTK